MPGLGPIRVVVDSSTCLDPEPAANLGITVVPMHIVIGGRSFRDLVEISPEEFYRSLRQDHNATHSTSSPPAGEYLQAFAGHREVLCLTVSSEISSMFQSASVAAGMAAASRAGRVRVIDSGTAAGGLRLLALEAARLAAGGMSLDDLEPAVAALAGRVRMFGMLDSIEYLARSGRVPQVASWGSSVLGVKPVVEFAGGHGSLVTLARGTEAGRRALARAFRKRALKDGAGADGAGVKATVFHADTPDAAAALQDELCSTLPAADISISHFTAAMGVHTGPGVLGHAFLVMPPDTEPVGEGRV